jgi:serine/threonine protein phosphatase 1
MLLAAFTGQTELRNWLRYGGMAALASYNYGGGLGLQPGALSSFIPGAHVAFIRQCRDYFESVGHFFVHGYYDPDLPLRQQPWDGMRWCSHPAAPLPHCSGKIAIVGHKPQLDGEILDLGCLKCIDTFCHGGGWLTALGVDTGQVWQANMAGQLRM